MSYVLRRLTTPLILLWIASGTSLPQTRAQTTYHVATCGNDTWTGTNVVCAGPGGPKATIQSAIIVAVNGDEVAVAPGTYNEAINFLGKAITVQSTDGPISTIIDGTGLDTSVVTCTSGETANTVLEGFTITGGTGTLRDSRVLGGGMIVENSSPTVTDCVFSGNTASSGGGVSNENSSATFSSCTFTNNIVGGFGGGMYNKLSSSLTVNQCTFTVNKANSGGGMYNYLSNPSVDNCVFADNVGGQGGGLTNSSSSPWISNCAFVGNWTDSWGGGMANTLFSNPTVTGCEFIANSTNTVDCSGIRCEVPPMGGGGLVNMHFSNPIIANCNFSRNFSFVGGGIYNWDQCEPVISNCNFHANSALSGSAMSNFFSGSIVAGCIFWDNDTGVIGAPNFGAVISFSNIQDSGGSGAGWNSALLGIDGGGNIDTDPMFVDPLGLDGLPGSGDEDLHLLSGSPCVNAGSIDGSNLPATDLGGQPRIQQCRVDMGVYESPFLIDCDGEGISDACEIEADPFLDCDVDGVLDTCQPYFGDCDFNGASDACDILATPNFDTNGNGLIDTCEGIFATNVTQSEYYGSITDAISFANDGDDLLAQIEAFSFEPNIDYQGMAITLTSVGDVVQPYGGDYVLADGAGLKSGSEPADILHLQGDLTVPAGARADLTTTNLISHSPSIIRVRTGGTLFASSTNTPVIYGHLQLDAGSLAVFDNNLVLGSTGTVHGILAAPVIWIDGTLDFYGGILEADSLEIGNKPGVLQGYGDIFGNLVNYPSGNAIFVANTQIVGDFMNHGVTTIQSGVLTIIGTLTNNGTIIGDFAGRVSAMDSSDAAAGGFFVKSDFDLGRNSTLVMPLPGAVVRVGGNFGAATSDRERFDMANAELRMVGLGGVQSMEIMSTDIGAAPRGLSRDHSGHYPLGTLRIGPTPTIVSLIDSHDNDQLGQTMQEAVYASELIVDAGARLETNGHLIYFVSSTVLGTVDDLSNLVPIVFLPGDMDGSGGLGLADYASFWECFEDVGNCPSGIFELADVNDDGRVNLADFAEIQGAFTGINTP